MKRKSNPVAKFMKQGEDGWRSTKQLHKSKKKYNRKAEKKKWKNASAG